MANVSNPGQYLGCCLGTSVVVTTWGAFGIEWVRTKDAAHHLAVFRMAPQRVI